MTLSKVPISWIALHVGGRFELKAPPGSAPGLRVIEAIFGSMAFK